MIQYCNMKIPDTTANVGAYYGNEENGQWQANGVVYDNGVGGVGSGDAAHRAVYPVHVPRGHHAMPPAGYVMAGAYFPPAAFPAAPLQDDFADYMWMENEEEFDKQVMQQLEEEALMEQCIEAMLEDEQRERRAANTQHSHNYPTTSTATLAEAVSRSTLNPLAAEFVPTGARAPIPSDNNTVSEEKEEQPPQAEPPVERTDTQTNDAPSDTNTQTQIIEEVKTEEPLSPPKDPPEVSAADVNPVKLSKTNVSVKKVEVKKPVKTEVKKAKPVVVKSETKVQPKKKEVKGAKSELKIDDKDEFPVVDVPKDVTTPEEQKEIKEVSSTPSLKPINYAAAAKSKSKAKSTTPPLETTIPTKTVEKVEKTKPLDKIEKKQAPKEKVAQKDKPIQRKNSTK